MFILLDLKKIGKLKKKRNSTFQSHPASLVTRFFGVYTLSVKGLTDLATLRVVAMSNVFYLPPNVSLSEQYDLKVRIIDLLFVAVETQRLVFVSFCRAFVQ